MHFNLSYDQYYPILLNQNGQGPDTFTHEENLLSCDKLRNAKIDIFQNIVSFHKPCFFSFTTAALVFFKIK